MIKLLSKTVGNFNAAINICYKDFCRHMFSFLLGKFIGVEWPGGLSKRVGMDHMVAI